MNKDKFSMLGGLIFGRIINANRVGRLLIERGISISSCESCTGGLFAASLVAVPGISEVYDRGIVTYSNRSKIEELGVNRETIDRYTAESKEVALEMVRGLYEKTGSRICISSTGVAGPDAFDGVDAGDMWIGISVDGECFVKEIKTGRTSRDWNRFFCARVMMHEIGKICLSFN